MTWTLLAHVYNLVAYLIKYYHSSVHYTAGYVLLLLKLAYFSCYQFPMYYVPTILLIFGVSLQDCFRVLSCSRDFSIRVYRWTKPQGCDAKPQLESRYTLLGGSVAHKTQ